MTNQQAFDMINLHETKRALIAIARRDDVDALRAFIHANGIASVLHYNDPDELTILHYAAASGSIRVVRFLLSEQVGADVNETRRNRFAPLHAASMNGAAETCALLLESGAWPNVQTVPQAYAPLHSAAWGGHIRAVEALLRGGALTDIKNYRGETPACTARRQGHPSVALRIETAAACGIGKE
jgi:ankyrin repeat protein